MIVFVAFSNNVPPSFATAEDWCQRSSMEKFLHFPVAQEGIWLPKLGAQVKICLTLTISHAEKRLFYLSTETNDDCSKNPGQLLLFGKSLGNLNQPFGERLLQKKNTHTVHSANIDPPMKLFLTASIFLSVLGITY